MYQQLVQTSKLWYYGYYQFFTPFIALVWTNLVIFDVGEGCNHPTSASLQWLCILVCIPMILWSVFSTNCDENAKIWVHFLHGSLTDIPYVFWGDLKLLSDFIDLIFQLFMVCVATNTKIILNLTLPHFKLHWWWDEDVVTHTCRVDLE